MNTQTPGVIPPSYARKRRSKGEGKCAIIDTNGHGVDRPPKKPLRNLSACLARRACQSCTMREQRIAAPMFVPANCKACYHRQKGHPAYAANHPGLVHPGTPAAGHDRNPAGRGQCLHEYEQRKRKGDV